ncbi:ABC transporter permease [Spongiibacter sp. KMU-166]|uniref:ABC transporter permease n=1 Tax=Spongiibacter thalassae TaxID=2721624 RepID=A0ABX1GDE1_9GAMM|nr:ABC transporter permease [Spongiibacter thalassae]NKI17166.1 ABC transporter permease [Spongiibacter thalassae]
MTIPVFRFAPWQPAEQQLDHIAPAPLPSPFTPSVVLASVAVLLLLCFVSVGPLLWPQSHSTQWLSQVSLGPTTARAAKVVRDEGLWRPHGDVRSLRVADANTERVRLHWPALPEVKRYQLYRGSGLDAGLGLPLAISSTPYYEDRLQLRRALYRYSIADADTGLLLFSVEVRPQQAISEFEARLQGLIVGHKTTLPSTIMLPAHPLGTDALGRDILARLMAGGATSLFVGVVAPLLFISLGCILGAIAGYAGGVVDQAIMRLADFVVALPFLLFMILFRVAFGIGPGENGIAPLILAMLVLSWPSSARLVRGQVLALKGQPYVESALLSGLSTAAILARHILPNVLPIILVAFSFAIPQAIFTEAFLSFIGMGVSPPSTSWGAMCNDGIKTLLSHPRHMLLPALFISISVLAFNILGDALRDISDRRSGGVGR